MIHLIRKRQSYVLKAVPERWMYLWGTCLRGLRWEAGTVKNRSKSYVADAIVSSFVV
ncbi:hypothetical protein DYBT9275_00683 [Dyadobacter sp. CECT 9275]|uniref:Uncharacterized protein n=1 Tax=Dyadobacter helix TaxID=2822344 RepID=A0A916NAK8_9BACT|nr:hypothetical protein DYBT9275_00683 [Dyadobacter sp. CECT 9275]